MKRLVFPCIYGLAALIAARGADRVATPDELAVYRTLFGGKGSIALNAPDPETAKPKPAPSNPRIDAEFAAGLKKSFPGVSDATIADYQRLEGQSALLTPQSDVGVELIFFSKKTADEIFRNKRNLDASWKAFRERFHVNGITSVTRVGFNRGRTQALVIRGFNYASLGGESYTYFLKKRHGRWIIMGQLLGAVS